MKKRFLHIEALLVFAAFVLVGFLFFISVGVKLNRKDIIQTPVLNTKELYCGISVTVPQINSTVSLPVQILGYVNGCGWETYSDYSARLKILDSDGKLVGRPYLIPKLGASLSPVSSQFGLKIERLPMFESKVIFVFESFGPEKKILILPVNIVEQKSEDVLKDES